MAKSLNFTIEYTNVAEYVKHIYGYIPNLFYKFIKYAKYKGDLKIANHLIDILYFVNGLPISRFSNPEKVNYYKALDNKLLEQQSLYINNNHIIIIQEFLGSKIEIFKDIDYNYPGLLSLVLDFSNIQQSFQGLSHYNKFPQQCLIVNHLPKGFSGLTNLLRLILNLNPNVNLEVLTQLHNLSVIFLDKPLNLPDSLANVIFIYPRYFIEELPLTYCKYLNLEYLPSNDYDDYDQERPYPKIPRLLKYIRFNNNFDLSGYQLIDDVKYQQLLKNQQLKLLTYVNFLHFVYRLEIKILTICLSTTLKNIIGLGPLEIIYLVIFEYFKLLY